MSVNNHRKCSKCGKTRAQDMTVTYHRFPKPKKEDFTKAQAWAKYCWPNQDWSSVESLHYLHISNKVLCGRHFDSSQFYDNKRQKLSIFAVPDSIESLDDQENIIEQIEKQSSVTGQLTSRVPLSEIENMQVEPSSSTCDLNQQTAIDIPSTSKSPAIAKNSSVSTAVPKCSTTEKMHSDVSHVEPTASVKHSKILSALNISKLSEMTSRELQLYNMCKKNVKEIMRLRKQLKKKKAKNLIKTISEEENVQDLCNLNISNSFAVLLQSQLKNWPKKPKGRRYTMKQKIMALVIYKKSPAGYRLLRRMFALPSQSSLNKLLNKVPLKPGINGHIFNSLKKMAQNQTDENNICILSFDEMSIRKHLYYNTKLDEIQGFHDHDNHGRSNEVATKALVFMLSGLRKKWKQPIGFYLSHSLTADRLTVILKEMLKECFDANMNVVATVCDLSTVNMKVLRTMGATVKDPFFSIYGHEIVTILDPPHLLKCTRNLLMKHNVECTTDLQCNDNPVKGIAKWSDIEAFYKIDKNNANFVFAPALTDNHLYPNIKQKMRVKLAAQIFSHSVAAGILAKIATNELPNEAHATATFLKKFDELFDAVNADSPDLRRGKKYSTNLTARSPHLQLFREMKKYITCMKYVNCKTNPPSQEGWIVTINAVEKLWSNLQAMNIKSLSTRRLNQDPLENFFGCIRYNCGSNNNPTIQQFVAGIKTAIISNLRHSGQKKNCEDDTAVLCTNLTSFLTKDTILTKETIASEFEKKYFDDLTTDAAEAVEQATPETQACGYVCGFIFKTLKHNNCAECKKAFLTDVEEAIHIFTSMREYETTQHSLNYVKKELITCVEIMATVINKYLEKFAWKPQIKQNVMVTVNDIDFTFLNNCRIHYERNKEHVIKCTFYICIKRFVILKNREMEEDEKRKALDRKMKIVRNK